MNISILLGSIRQERKSHKLAYYLKDQIAKKELDVNLIDMKDYPLPLFGAKLFDQDQKNINAINNLLKGSQAVIIVTPEYFSNISAVTKNVLEYCGRELIGKVTAVASSSATQFGGLHASNNLQIALLNLGSYPSSRRLLVPEIHLAFNEHNEPLNEEIKIQITKFVDELVSHATLLESRIVKN